MARALKLRLMLETPIPAGDRFAVCIGDVGRPGRRCWWRVVGTYESETDADFHYDCLDRYVGRALVHLDCSRVTLVERDGSTV